jgi:dipeptidyl aminopeptidase/acylaminoacyl peptidase
MKRAPVPADLERIAQASDPQITPDGARTIACLATFDRERDTIVRTLWEFTEASARALTVGPDDREPAISPDGRTLAFVTGRAPARIALLPLDAPECMRTLGDAGADIAGLAWSPDGARLAFTALAEPDAAVAAIYRDAASGALHIRSGAYKDDGRGTLDGRTRALFTLDVASGRTQRLVDGPGDIASPAWSPDGREIAFARHAAGRAARMCGTIAIIDVASGRMRALTAGDGPAYAPAYAPDGRTIAYAGHGHGDDNRFGVETFLVPAAGGEPRSLTRALDRPVGNVLVGDLRSGTTPRVRWLTGGREVAMLVTDAGACSVVAIDVGAGTARTLAGGDRDIAGFAPAANGSFAIAYATPLEPSAIACVGPDGSERVLAALNPWLAEVALVAPQRIAVTSDGARVEGWLLAPVAAGAATRDGAAPLVLAVHPGPHAAYGWTFVLEYQILAGCGIGVVFGNPRGSLGYGEAFALGSTGDWGGGDARDLLALLDAAIARAGADPQRIACIGQSYGGFMVTWLLGHTTRFATGISMDAVNDFASLYGASDVGWSMETELAADVAADAGAALFQRSALRAARAIVAPLLIVHGERDQRCPIDQSEQLYTALRFGGDAEVEFVRFPGGTHELSRSGNPRERVLRLRAIANWLVRRLLDPSRPAGAGSLFAPIAGEVGASVAREESRL